METEKLRNDFKQRVLDNEDIIIEAYRPMKSRYTKMLSEVKRIFLAWVTIYEPYDILSVQTYWPYLESQIENELMKEGEARESDVKDALMLVFTTTYFWLLDYENWDKTAEDENNTSEDMFLILFGTVWAADGLTYQQRLESRRKEALSQIKKIVMRGMAMGTQPKKIWESIYHELDKIKYRGSTQIADEAQRLANEAVRMASTSRSNGYYVNEILDNRTCEFCRGMDSKYFSWDDYSIGITAPQFHPRCRGIIIPDFR